MLKKLETAWVIWVAQGSFASLRMTLSTEADTFTLVPL
jgi:hypothetical protein